MDDVSCTNIHHEAAWTFAGFRPWGRQRRLVQDQENAMSVYRDSSGIREHNVSRYRKLRAEGTQCQWTWKVQAKRIKNKYRENKTDHLLNDNG